MKTIFSTKKIKIYMSPYKLNDKNKNFFKLEGVLLSFHFDSKFIGYSDFLPWPLFGEKNLSQQLEDVKRGIESKRFFIAKKNAWLDAVARFKKQNLFFGLAFPPSHFLIENLLSFSEQKTLLKGHYRFVKVKLRPFALEAQLKELKKIVKELPKTMKWRLDLNGQKWSLWKDKLTFMKSQIDFIEDPFLDHQKISQEDYVFFAEDWLPNPLCKIRIVKPSRDSLEDVIKGVALSRWKRVVFTHSFDHPLGQAISVFWATQFYKNHPRFFETSALKCLDFQESPFYFHKFKNPFLEMPKGFGFGFDRLLQEECWERLV